MCAVRPPPSGASFAAEAPRSFASRVCSAWRRARGGRRAWRAVLHSLLDGDRWMEEGDPRGNGHFPCAWSARAPVRSSAPMAAAARRWRPTTRPAAHRRGRRPVRRVAAPSDGVLLATYRRWHWKRRRRRRSSANSATGMRRWRRRAPARAIVPGSKRVSALCAELGVAHVQLPAASGGWAAAAAACAAFGAAWIEHEGRSLVLASPHVVWLRDPAPFVECAQPTADGGADGGVESLECAPVAPADALVASEMLSVKQDALFGAGFAKWGALDPSVLVLRASGWSCVYSRGRAPSKPRRGRRPRGGGRSARGRAPLSGRGPARRGLGSPSCPPSVYARTRGSSKP